jgi:alkylhydroperoxidase family enzyme
MSRIPQLPAEKWDPELKAAMDGAGVEPGTFQWRANATLAHAPHMAKANAYWMAAAMAGRSLSRRLLELVRLRLAFHSQCRSCMAMRFSSAMDEGFTEDLVCSLEEPMEAPDLSAQEKAALEYADVFATNHFSINEETFARLREHFTEAEIIELGMFVGFFHGTGKFLATLDMTEELPKVYQDKSEKAAPWKAVGEVVLVQEFVEAK